MDASTPTYEQEIALADAVRDARAACDRARAALEGRSVDSMTTPEMMLLGRSLIKETDAALARSARVVAETQAVGAKTAEALAGQTEQFERVFDDADALRESLKRGRGALLDVVRGAATDRCLAFLLMLVVLAAVAALVAKLVVRKPAAAPAAGRRLLAAAVAAAAVARR